MEKFNFCSLSSGSSGNSYYIGNESEGLLIDAGISATSIRRFLNSSGIGIESIMGVLVTHNHSDHIRGLEVLVRRNHLPVYTTDTIWRSIISSKRNISGAYLRRISLKQRFSLAGFEIEAFPVSHDAPETIGFHVIGGEKSVTIATDLGHICSTVAQYIEVANLVVIESNYDEQMLTNGRYPHYLKKRIKSDRGHLGNHQTAALLAGISNTRMSHICLAHLSKNNNTPEIALKTLENAYSERGVNLNGNIKVLALRRDMPSEMIRVI